MTDLRKVASNNSLLHLTSVFISYPYNSFHNHHSLLMANNNTFLPHPNLRHKIFSDIRVKIINT